MMFIYKVAEHVNSVMSGNKRYPTETRNLINVLDRVISGGNVRPRDLEILRDEKMRVIIDFVVMDGENEIDGKTYGDLVSRYHKFPFTMRPPVDLVIDVLNCLRELGVLSVSENEVCRLHLDADWLVAESGWIDICKRIGYPNFSGSIRNSKFAKIDKDKELPDWRK